MRQIVFILVFFTTFSHAQIMGDVETDNDTRKLSDAQLKNAIVLHDKMTASEDYIEWQKSFDYIYSIANKDSNPKSFLYNVENRNEKKIQDWVTINIPAKKQKEATKLLLRIVFLEDKILVDNSVIINILKYEASFSQCEEIAKPNLRKK
ncbi:hypothetical protein [Flavobacterium limi]|nr:hypothetical protein [Flavobacterium limi]